MTASEASLGPRVTLAMMPTAALREFRDAVDDGSHLLVVADEVHQSGSTRNSEFFSVYAGARLGLSATPQRFGDPKGTARLLGYLGRSSASDHVDGRHRCRPACPYEYHPHPAKCKCDRSRQLAQADQADPAGDGPPKRTEKTAKGFSLGTPSCCSSNGLASRRRLLGRLGSQSTSSEDISKRDKVGWSIVRMVVS